MLNSNKTGNIEFDTPANRIIAQQQPKERFRIDTSLPDIAFLRQLSVQGRLQFFQSPTITNTTPLQIIPANGSTFFYYRGIFTTGSQSTINIITIINDGMTREQFLMPQVTTDLASYVYTSEFVDALVGDGIKVFEVTASASSNVRGSIFGWTENTSRIRDVTA